MSKSFDLKVHIRDERTGEVVAKQPYSLHVIGGKREFVRDGVRYHPDGTQCDKNQKPLVTSSQKKENLDESIKMVQDAAEKLDSQTIILNENRKKLEEEKAAFELEKSQSLQNSQDLELSQDLERKEEEEVVESKSEDISLEDEMGSQSNY